MTQSKSTITGGNELKTRRVSDNRSNFYLVDLNVPISGKGILTSWEIWADKVTPVQLVIYRKTANVWSVVGKSDLKTPALGLNQFALTTAIAVQAGDFAGVYYPQTGSVSFNRKTEQEAWDLGNLSGSMLFTNTGAAETAFSGSSNRVYSLKVHGIDDTPVFVPIKKPDNGQIIVNNDEWTLSDVGFQSAPDTADYIEPTAPAPQPEPTPPPATPEPPKPKTIETEEFSITAEADVFMSNLVYKGLVKRTQSDEYVELSNRSNHPVNISGWKITSAGSPKQQFTFPANTVLAAGKTFRVYTNEVHSETGGFSFASKTAIWNDAGDELNLYDATGKKVSTLAYGASLTKK